MNKEKELLLELLIEKITNKYKSFDTDSNGDLLYKKYSQLGIGKFLSYSEMYQIIKKYSPNK
jgi:hypothetical protein